MILFPSLAFRASGTEVGFENGVASFLGSSRGLERALAVRILGRTPGTNVDRIIAMLDEPDWNVRHEAVEALSRGGKTASERLAALRGGLQPLGRFWADKVRLRSDSER